ncbi:MAG: phosphatase PAP2 family protein [Pseudomonadota bacterium]
MTEYHLNFFDSAIVGPLNTLARNSWAIDQAIAFISFNHIVKGGVLMVLLWWGWFRQGERGAHEREHTISTLIGCAVALMVGRLMVLALPFRLRPMHQTDLHFTVPFGVAEGAMDGLSSFPSDHAVLFFALACGMFFISRAMGWVALIYTFVMIALPRIYLGLHYPTDILGGAAVGALICWVANKTLPQTPLVQYIKGLSFTRPEIFYPMLFFVTYQIADLFENLRDIVGGIYKLIKSFVG